MKQELCNKIYEELKEKSNSGELDNGLSAFFAEKQEELQKAGEEQINLHIGVYYYLSERYGDNLGIDWQMFFSQKIGTYFKVGLLSADFTKIISDKRNIDIIFKFCSFEVVKDFYNVFLTRVRFGQYKELFEELKPRFIAAGVMTQEMQVTQENSEISELTFQEQQEGPPNTEQEDISTSEITSEINEPITNPVEPVRTPSQISAEIRNLQAQQVANRDKVFSGVASDLGVNSSDLIGKVGEEASLDVDNIVVDDAVVEMVAERQDKVATVSNSTLRRMKERSNKRKNLRRMGIEVVNDGSIQTVRVVKKDTVFDKIATTGKNVLGKIKNGIKIAGGVALTTAVLGIYEPEVLMDAIKNKKIKDFDMSGLTAEAKAFAETLKPIILRSGTSAGSLNMTPPEMGRTM